MAALAAVTAGCLQPSLNPLFLAEDSIFDERLLGAWTCPQETWTFARASNKGLQDRPFYKVTVEADRRKAELGAWLGRLDQTAFITFALDELDTDAPTDFVTAHMLGVYTFGRVTVGDATLQFAMLDRGWIDAAETAGQLTIGVRRRHNTLAPSLDTGPPAAGTSGARQSTTPMWMSEVILTAPPADLQRFARAYADDDRVFGEMITLVRPSAPNAPTPAGSAPARGSCYR